MFRHHLCVASSGVGLSALFNIVVGKKEGGEGIRTQTSPILSSLKSAFYLLFLLPNIATSTLQQGKAAGLQPLPISSSSKSVFFLLFAGPQLLLLPVLLELSSLTELWSMDRSSGATACYIAEHHPAPVVICDINWSESRKLLADLRLDLSCCFWIFNYLVM